MQFSVASSRRRANISTRVVNVDHLVLGLFEQVAEARLHEGPGARIFGLLLAPHDLSVCVALQRTTHVAEGERSDLFNTHQRNVVDSSLFAFRFEVIVDLS